MQIKLQQSLPDTTRLHVLQQLAEAYTSVNPDKKFYYANVYKALAEKLHNEPAVADSYIHMGISCGIRGKVDSGLYYFYLAFNKAEKINYLLGMGRSLADIGFAYDRLDNKKEAVQNYFQALEIFKKLHYLRGINQCYTNIGSIYYDMKQYKLAESYFSQCLKNYTQSNDEAGIGYALYTIANCYQALGMDEKAMDYFNRSLVIREKLGDVNGTGLAKRGIGIVYRHLKQYDLAISNLKAGLKDIQSLKDVYEECAILHELADVYIDMQQYDKAKVVALQSLMLARTVKSKTSASLSQEKLVLIYRRQHQLDKAFRYQSEYVAIQDSILTEKALKDVSLIEISRTRSENAALNKANQLIKSKNTDYRTKLNEYGNVIIITSVILASAVLVLLMLYRRNLEKQATNKQLRMQKEEIALINQELETLNEEVTAQMELTNAQNIELERLNDVKNKFFTIISHDLRSPLSTLQTLFSIYRAGDLGEQELGNLLIQLEDTILSTGAFLDNLLEWSKNQLDGMVVNPISFDVNDCITENIRLYETKINLKQLAVINQSVTPVLIHADRNMINLVIRNLLSNSIKFCNPGDHINFNTVMEDGQAIISISDDGPGISEKDREKLFSLEHTLSTGTQGEKGNHLGLILCRDMIIQNKGQIGLESKPGHGTTFQITLPVATFELA